MEWRLRLRLITPVIGGGVDAGKTDRVTPIRGSAIKGQLRFWWRAVNPKGCRTLAELAVREAEVFGSAKGPDPSGSRSGDRRGLRVAVRSQPALSSESTAAVWAGTNGNWKYACLAFGKDDSDRTRHVFDYSAFPFEVTIDSNVETASEVQAALWAWVTFGGIGSRTRRGFGSLSLESLDGPDLSTGVDCVEQFSRFVRSSREAGPSLPWPHLTLESPPALSSKVFPSAAKAHEHLIGKLRAFRSGLGLPELDNAKPQRPRLVPRQVERMASPLVVRPHPEGDGCRALAVRIHHPAIPPDRAGRRVRVDLVILGSVQLHPVDAFLHQIRSQS